MISQFRHLRIHLNQFSNNRRQLYAFTSIIPIQRNVNHEETRKLSLCASSSAVCYTDHSKEKMLSVTNLRRVMSQIYSRQSFSFSSRFNSLQQSHLEGSLLAPPRDDLSLILGILPPSTTLDSVKELFSRIGQVTHLRFGYVKAENGTLNKYSYVTFATKEQLAKALEGKYRLNGQRVTVKPKKDTPFSDDESDDDEVDSDRKKKTNRSLGYAYVAFSTAKVLANALQPDYSVDDQPVAVKPNKDTTFPADDERDDCSDDDEVDSDDDVTSDDEDDSDDDSDEDD